MRNLVKLSFLSRGIRRGIINSDNEAALMTTILGNNAIGVVRGTPGAQSTEQAVSGIRSYKYTVDTADNLTHYALTISSLRGDRKYRFVGNLYVPTGSLGTIKIIDINDGSFTAINSTVKDAWIPFDVTRQPKGSNWVFAIGNNANESINGASVYIDDLQIYES